jgi:hypothetical protein
VAECERCGRRLCISCAVPFRGGVVGRECLRQVLPDTPLLIPAAPVAPRPWDVVAAAAFGLVLAMTLFPWSKFGEDSGSLEAWSRHWSLLSAAAAAGGLLAAVSFALHPWRLRLEAAVYTVFGMACGAGAFLHHLNPPPLSEPSAIPLVAMVGPTVVLGVAAAKALAAFRTGWAR